MREAVLALVAWILVAPAEGQAQARGLLFQCGTSRPACNIPEACTTVIAAAPGAACTSCKPDQPGLLARIQECHDDAMSDPCQHGLLASHHKQKACKAAKRDHFLDWLCYRPKRSHCEKKHECCCVPPLYLFFLCSGCGTSSVGCSTCGGCR